MVKYIGLRTALLSLAAAAVLGACGGEPKKGPDSLGADTTLNRDLSLAGKDTGVQPQLNDVPANQPAAPATKTASAERPRTSTPRPSTPTKKAPAPEPKPVTTPSGNQVTTTPGGGTKTGGGSVGTIDAGTSLNLASNSKICTNTNAVG